MELESGGSIFGSMSQTAVGSYILGFLRLIRFPNLVILVGAQYLTAVFLVGHPGEVWQYLSDPKLFFLALATGLLAAAGYIINDYYDVKIDYINRPDQVVVGKQFKRRWAMALHTIFSITGVGIGLLIWWPIGVVNFLTAFSLWWYSNQLKRLPFVGNFMVSFLTAASIAIIALLYQEQMRLVLTFAGFAFSISLIREVIKDMEDLQGDATFGCRTLPIVWGIPRTKWFLFVWILGFQATLIAQGIILEDKILIGYFVALIVPMAYLLYRLYWADTQQEFGRLSTYCKGLMVIGILSMIFF